MKISAIVPWYGSKRTLAPRIIAELGPHTAYWEPFCGSCSVILGKKPVTYESVNDLHQDLINLALVIQDRDKAHELYAKANPTLFHEDMCRLSKEKTLAFRDEAAAGDVERAYWYLIFSWFHLNGIAGTKLNRTGNMGIRYSSKGGNGAARWRSVVESIPDWHERLLRVQIVSRDALELLQEIEDADGTVIYCDPPYILKKARYLHDFETSDHQVLAGTLRRFRKTRIVLSYYEHPKLNSLYEGWTKIGAAELGVAKSMVNSGMRDESGRTEAPEVLFINGPACASERTLFAGVDNSPS